MIISNIEEINYIFSVWTKKLHIWSTWTFYRNLPYHLSSISLQYRHNYKRHKVIFISLSSLSQYCTQWQIIIICSVKLISSHREQSQLKYHLECQSTKRKNRPYVRTWNVILPANWYRHSYVGISWVSPIGAQFVQIYMNNSAEERSSQI